MLFNGERIGDGSEPEVDIAVDPLEGTRLAALGMPSALAVIALSPRGTMFDPGPCVYMEKIAVGPFARGVIDISASASENLHAVAKAKGESVRDLTVVILDRERHLELIGEVTSARVNVKATTNEGMGWIGRGEAISLEGPQVSGQPILRARAGHRP
jgi:fructose-1,6-bisphosphatase II